jgi:hypothetical protein
MGVPMVGRRQVMKGNLIYWLLGSLVLLTGCETPAPTGAWGATSTKIDEQLANKLQANGVLAFLNDQSTTAKILDREVALDVRAARELIAHRDGWDTQPGTADDNLFESMEEVDGVDYVGSVALGRLQAFVMKYGWVPAEYDHMGAWNGVSFTWIQGSATVDFVNTCSFEELDVELGLDRRAAESIILAQPLSSINTLSNLSYVGTKTLTTLRDVGTALYMLERSTGTAAMEEPLLTPVEMQEAQNEPEIKL